MAGEITSYRVRFLRRGKGDKVVPPWLDIDKLRGIGITGVRVTPLVICHDGKKYIVAKSEAHSQSEK